MSHCKESFSFVCKIHLELLNSLFNRIFSNWLTCQILDSVFSQPYNPGFCTRQYNQHLHCTESWILRFKNTLTLHPPPPPSPLYCKRQMLINPYVARAVFEGGGYAHMFKKQFQYWRLLKPQQNIVGFLKAKTLKNKMVVSHNVRAMVY